MNADSIPLEERRLLLAGLRRFRSHCNESGVDYSHRDLLEQKLQSGGYLNELDIYVLRLAVLNEWPDTYEMFSPWLG